MDQTSDKLRIGDIITLEHAKPYEGWLAAEDVFNSECILTTSDIIMEDCLWQVCVQYQYSSSSDYETTVIDANESVMKQNEDRKPSTDPNQASASEETPKIVENNETQKKLQLQRAAATETKLNKKLMAMKFGKPVSFGDVVQLLHIKSQTYMTVSSNCLARCERENLQVYLDSNGNPLSWLELMPRYKYDREGQHISSDTELYIRVHENSSDFIHVAKKASKLSESNAKEINCSLESSCWRINIYQNASEFNKKNILMGNLVTLKEPESSTYLTVDAPNISSHADVVMSNSIQLSFSSADCYIGTNLLWMIEGEDVFHGGSVTNYGSKVALRDLTSGLYMKMTDEGVSAVRKREDCSFFELAGSHQSDLDEFIPDGTLINLSCQKAFVMMMKGKDAVLRCVGSRERSAALSVVISSKIQERVGVDLFKCVDAVRILKRQYKLVKNLEKSEYSMSVLLTMLRENMFCFDFLEEFMVPESSQNLFNDSAKHSNFSTIAKAELQTSTATTYLIRQTLMREQGVLDALLDLVELTSATVLSSSVNQKAEVEVRRRDNNRGVINISMARDRESSRGPAVHKYLGQNAHVPQVVEINECCLRILYLCMSRNHFNQVHVADRLPVILELVKESELAVTCVEEMIRDNVKILQTKVRDREIKIFLKMLVESEFNSTLLKLLRSACSCQFGVDSTQRIIAEALFPHKAPANGSGVSLPESSSGPALSWSETSPMHGFALSSVSSNELNSMKPVVISLFSQDGRRRVVWPNKSIYIPDIDDITVKVWGINLIYGGLLKIFLTWDSTSNSISSIFNIASNEITLERICGEKASVQEKKLFKSPSSSSLSYQSNHHKIGGSSRKIMKKKPPRKQSRRMSRIVSQQSIAEKTGVISEYLVAQLYLAADLCLDRNYVAMGLLEGCFPYDVLISVVKNPIKNSGMKASACRLIRCLYVDREPQITNKYPNLVKTTHDVTSRRRMNNGFGEYDENRVSPRSYTFAVLQIVISDYLHHAFDATKCNELSSEMMDTLLALVQFGFYESADQLQDIITPLVQALDDHYMNRSKDVKNIGGLSKKSSIVLLHEKIGKNVSLFDSTKKKSTEKLSSSEDNRSSNGRVNVNFRHSRRTLNEAMRNSLSVQEKSSQGDDASSMGTFSLANESSMKNFIDIDVDNVPVELRTLRMLESLPALIIILLIVIFSTIFATVQITTGHQQDFTTYVVELLVSAVFFFELVARSSCYFLVHKELNTFVAEPLNILDILLVAFDICLIAFDATILGNAGAARSYAKTLKVFRILRLIRVFRAARIIKRLAERSAVVVKWIEPERYKKTTEYEIRTITSILQILSIIHLKIIDRKLSTSLLSFMKWQESHKVEGNYGEKCDPHDLYEELMVEDNLLTNAFPKHFENNLLDILMYSDGNMVQEALNLLLIHKSQEKLLFDYLNKLQIICTPKMQSKFVDISAALKKIYQLAEAFEIWSKLETSQDIAVAEMALEAIILITSYVKVEVPLTKLDLTCSQQVDSEVQLLLLNVNAIDTFMTLQFALLDDSLTDDGDRNPIVLRIVRACNDLISLYVYKNPANQATTFKHFDWFVERIDEKVNSSKVVRAILSGNRDLVKHCPRKYLPEFIQKIAVNGQRAEYLDLFVGLTEVEDSGDSSISQLRNEISRYVTNTEKSRNMLLWCCPRRSKEYEARVMAMEPFTDIDVPLADDELPNDLQYHINLLQLIVGCKLGPKIQAIYPVDDVVVAILDPRTIFNVKRSLGLLLLEIVESHTVGLECSEHIWLFVDDCIDTFEEINEELSQSRRSDGFVKSLSQKSEWVNICITILTIYFKDFDFVVFNDDGSFGDESFTQITHRTENDVRASMHNVFTQISILRDKCEGSMNSRSLDIIDNCLACWENLSNEYQEGVEFAYRMRSNSQQNIGGNKNEKARRPSVVAEIQQIYYRKHFQDFVDLIREGRNIKRSNSMDIFERLPSIYDPINADIRLEPFISKISDHLRNKLDRSRNARSLDKKFVDSSIWVIQTMKLLLSDTCGIKYDDAYESILDQKDMEFSYYHLAMNDYGIVYLCLDFIAVGIDDELCVEAIDLLVMLLHKSNGRKQIQHTIFCYLEKTDSTLFFEKLKDLLEQLVLWCERNHSERIKKKVTKPLPLPAFTSVLALISNMTADNFYRNKQIMLVQEGNNRFVNVLDHMSHFLDVLSRLEGPQCMRMSVFLTHSILGLLQGPDKSCQEHFVIRTDMLMALNRFMRTRCSSEMTQAWKEDFDTVKENLVDILRASIEGQPSTSVVVERIQTTIEISILNVIILPVDTDENGNNMDLNHLSRLQAKYLVFLQALGGSNSDVPTNAVGILQTDIAFVEVLWHGNLTKHYFHVPEITKDLSEGSKEKLTEEIAFTTQEKKLRDFLKKSRQLHQEIEHQQIFKYFGVVHLWGWKMLIAKLLFVNCLIMNGLMTAYYTSSPNSNEDFNNRFSSPILGFGYDIVEGDIDPAVAHGHRFLSNSTSSSPYDVSLPMRIYDAIHVLNGVHIGLSILAYIIILAIQVPLLFQKYVDKGKFKFVAVLLALFNPVPLWYLIHTFISLEAYSRTPLFLSLLLLQFIAVDSASNEVMLAVIYPFRQLLTTLIIIVIFIHIFASTVFVFFRDELLNLPCNSMWQSFKLMISYGFRSEEGIGKYMEDTIGIRIIVDVAFYFIIVVILRNIFFGIIIDTFGELRGVKVERQIDSNNRCFICGMDQNEYDKNNISARDFIYHRSVTHNMWNYLYFLIKIWKQEPSQDTSLEKYVRLCLSEESVNWFPIGIVGTDEGGNETEYLAQDDAADSGYDAVNKYEYESMTNGVSSRMTRHSRTAKETVIERKESDIDSQLQHIQSTLGKLSARQSRAQATKLGSLNDISSSNDLDSHTKEIIKNIIEKEFAPISAALIEATNDMNVIMERLEKMSENKKPKKYITLSPKKK